MNNEYYGTASTPTEDFLAHYGVKGMKWGVRKAVQSGNMRKLGRQYNKAAKKLAKLEKRAASGKKYAKRAAVYGAGAAAAGGLAAVGTKGVGTGLKAVGNASRSVLRGAGNAVTRLSGGKYAHVGNVLKTAGNRSNAALIGAGNAVKTWGAGDSVGKIAKRGANAALQATPNKITRAANNALKSGGHAGLGSQINRLGNISNSGYARLASAAVGAGLGVAAARNAYKAATTKRAAKKAAQFRSEMNKAFAGTAYANGRPASQKKKKRR